MMGTTLSHFELKRQRLRVDLIEYVLPVMEAIVNLLEVDRQVHKVNRRHPPAEALRHLGHAWCAVGRAGDRLEDSKNSCHPGALPTPVPFAIPVTISFRHIRKIKKIGQIRTGDGTFKPMSLEHLFRLVSQLLNH